jgi:hypothetical protein
MIHLYNSIKRKVSIGLECLTKEGRLSAWMVLLGIDIEAPDIEKLRSDYWNVYLPN